MYNNREIGNPGGNRIFRPGFLPRRKDMTRKLLSLVLILCAGIFVAYGCEDGGGKKDADADVPIDHPPDTPIDTPADVPPDRDVVPDQDVTPDVPTETEITPDLPPDSTGCNPLQGGTCSVIDNCNCTSGQACTFVLNPTDSCDVDETCAPSAGTIPTGSTCVPAASDPCAPGNACLTNSATGESFCYKWCDGIEDCEAGHDCTVGISFDMGTECPAPLTLTYKACDLGCPADKACDPFTGTGCTSPYSSCWYEFDCGVTICASTGTHAVDEDCSDTGTCVIGAECLTTDSGVTNFCRAFCDSSHACTTGTCQTFTPAYTANPTLGACLP
jgi:hypothetical protein